MSAVLHAKKPIETMNDRLGDIGESIPSWALEDDDVDKMETGNQANLELTDLVGSSNGADENDDPWGEKPAPQPKYMVTFFADVDNIKADITSISEGTRRIGEINEESLLATTTDKETELSAQLKPLIDLTNKKAKRAKNLLAIVKEDNEKLKEDDSVKASDLR